MTAGDDTCKPACGQPELAHALIGERGEPWRDLAAELHGRACTCRTIACVDRIGATIDQLGAWPALDIQGYDTASASNTRAHAPTRPRAHAPRATRPRVPVPVLR